MAAIVLFLVVHIALALLVPRTLVSMLTGGPVVNDVAEPAPAADPDVTAATESAH
jgi:hypothetical protein